MAKKQFATKDNLQTLVNELKTRVVLPQAGKGLSANDLTNELLARLNAAQDAEQVNAAVSQAVAEVDLDGYVREDDFQELTDAEITGLFASWS